MTRSEREPSSDNGFNMLDANRPLIVKWGSKGERQVEGEADLEGILCPGVNHKEGHRGLLTSFVACGNQGMV